MRQLAQLFSVLTAAFPAVNPARMFTGSPIPQEPDMGEGQLIRDNGGTSLVTIAEMEWWATNLSHHSSLPESPALVLESEASLKG